MCRALEIYVQFHSCQSFNAIKRSDIWDRLWSVKERFLLYCILTCTSVNPHSTFASSNSGLMQCKSVVWPQVFRIRRSRDTNMLLSLKIGKYNVVLNNLLQSEWRQLSFFFILKWFHYKQGVKNFVVFFVKNKQGFK